MDANCIDNSDNATQNATILDPNYVYNIFEAIHNACQNKTKYVSPMNITISNAAECNDKTRQLDKKTKSGYNVYVANPQWNIEDIYLTDDNREIINSVIGIIQNRDKLYKEWGFEKTFKKCRPIVLNFYGTPGTGKTITADAIAMAAKKKIINVNYSELESKYVGDTPKNISRIFSAAKEHDAVIVFDEADSFLGKRIENVQQSADYGVNVTRSVMLMELDNFDGVVVFTTNLYSNYDEAFKRRILMNIKFSLPDRFGREAIWRNILPEKFPLDHDITAEILSSRYENVSGADIKDIVFNCAVLALQNNVGYATLCDFDKAYNIVNSRYGDQSNYKIAKITTERVEESGQY